MAIAGDVIIKLAADFAEFAKGMNEATGKLEAFGKKSEETSNRITSFLGLVKAGIAALGIGAAISRIKDYADEIQTLGADIGTMATTLGLSTDAFQAYRAAAIDSGNKIESVTGAISRFNVSIGQAAQGSKAQLDVLNELGVKILDINGKQRAQTDILTETAAALLKVPEGAKRATAEVTLFGKAGQEMNSTLGLLSKSTVELVEQYKQLGLIIDGETLRQLDDLERKAQLAKARMDALAAPFVANIKTSVAGFIADQLKIITDQLILFESHSSTIDKIRDLLNILSGGLGSRIAGAVTGEDTSPLGQANRELAQLSEKAIDLGNSLRYAEQNFGANSVPATRYRSELAEVEKQIDATRGAIEKLSKTPTMPTVTTTGDRGGGGARNPPTTQQASQAEDIERQIKRYEELAKAAQAAMRTIEASRGVAIEDMQRSVAVQQQIDDIIGKVSAKGGISDDQRKRLTEAVTASETWRAAVQRRLQDETAADAIERRLGDGTAAMARALRDLDRQRDTGRISAEAYNRALKEQTEATEQAALAARRYDDDLGSLAAGFQHAANDYARSNDLYSTGEQTFTALTDAMGEGLDVLAGKSSKTFGDIANDFAMMLAKMALQASASSIFKSIFGNYSTTSVTGETVPSHLIADAQGSRGGLFSWLGSIFGGGRATGGPVQPGFHYLVGEQGPEHFVPMVAGMIEPRHDTTATRRSRTELSLIDERLDSLARRIVRQTAASFNDVTIAAGDRTMRSPDVIEVGGRIFRKLLSVTTETLDTLLRRSSHTLDAPGAYSLAPASLASAPGRVLGGDGPELFAPPVAGIIEPSRASGIDSVTRRTSETIAHIATVLQAAGPAFVRMLLPDMPAIAPLLSGGGRASGGEVRPGYYYTVGENGPERFVPQVAGRIEPTTASGGGGVTVNVANYSNASVSAKPSKTAGGQTQIDIIVEAVEGKLAGRLSRGQGGLGRTMEGTYGLQRVGR